MAHGPDVGGRLVNAGGGLGMTSTSKLAVQDGFLPAEYIKGVPVKLLLPAGVYSFHLVKRQVGVKKGSWMTKSLCRQSDRQSQ